LLSETFPDGTRTSYTYDYHHPSGLHLLIAKVDERGNRTEYAYDALGNRIRITEAAGSGAERVSEYTYNAYGQVLSITRLGDDNTTESTTTMTYDPYLKALTGPEGGTTFYTYDWQGNVLTVSNPDGKVTSYTYDAAGNQTSVTDPLGNTRHMTYDERGRVAEVVDPLNNATAFSYDTHDRLLASTDPLGGSNVMVYDVDGNLVKRSDGEGRAARSFYDAEGRLSKTVDGNNNEIVYTYGDDGNGTCTTCPLSGKASDQPIKISFPTFVREFSYDTRGRKTEQRDIAGATTLVTGFTYDQSGNLSLKTDPEGRVTRYYYDELNRLARTVDPDQGDTLFTYDDRDNLLSLTDANGNVTSFTYDSANRLLSETRPGGGVISYTYDAGGRLAGKTDPLGNKEVYAYDEAGRLSKTALYRQADLVNPVRQTTYTYDADGRLTAYDDGGSKGAYVYDAVGRKTGETVSYGPFSLSQSYTYYKNGRKESYTGPDGKVYTYTYDAGNQLSGIDIPGQGVVTFNSYKWTSPSRITLPGGTVRNYSYDGLMRLTGISVSDPIGNSLMNYTYSFDNTGNITGKTTGIGNYAYSYDNLNRLTAAANPTQANENYTYDSLGNRLTAAGVIEQWVYNENNELKTSGRAAFTYDAAGNTTSRTENGVVTRQYTYTADNRLARVSDGANADIAAYGYDPFGRRLWKEIGGTRTYYLYSDEGLVGEYDDTGAEIKTYGRLPNAIWGSSPLFMSEDGQYYWYLNDHLGTPQKLINSSGQVVWSALYDTFGQAQVDTASVVGNNLRFPGQYYDAETGLHNNWHRYYDPETGRYMTPDPIGLDGGINLYGYVGNNPINFVDPNGQWAVGAVIGAVAGGLGGVNSALISGGSLKSDIIGGISGGLAGAVVGGALPDFVGLSASNAAGAMAGSIFGGAVGGATGGLISSAIAGNVSGNAALVGAATGAFAGTVAAPGVGLAAIGTGGSELGMALMGATGGILGDTIGAAGLGIKDATSCGK